MLQTLWLEKRNGSRARRNTILQLTGEKYNSNWFKCKPTNGVCLSSERKWSTSTNFKQRFPLDLSQRIKGNIHLRQFYSLVGLVWPNYNLVYNFSKTFISTFIIILRCSIPPPTLTHSLVQQCSGSALGHGENYHLFYLAGDTY